MNFRRKFLQLIGVAPLAALPTVAIADDVALQIKDRCEPRPMKVAPTGVNGESLVINEQYLLVWPGLDASTYYLTVAEDGRLIYRFGREASWKYV